MTTSTEIEAAGTRDTSGSTVAPPPTCGQILVAVTPNLSANTTGTLPVHCIHQLLKNRGNFKTLKINSNVLQNFILVISNHRISIKSWILADLLLLLSPPSHHLSTHRRLRDLLHQRRLDRTPQRTSLKTFSSRRLPRTTPTQQIINASLPSPQQIL